MEGRSAVSLEWLKKGCWDKRLVQDRPFARSGNCKEARR
jgi:hypothetical protein